MIQFCFVVTLLSSCAGAFVVVTGVSAAKGAPQEAAAAAIGIALAVIPYVFSRSIQIASDSSAIRSGMERMAALLQDLKPAPLSPVPVHAAIAGKIEQTAAAVVPLPEGPKGECPNCEKVVPLASALCPHCKAVFGPNAAWKIKPL